MSICVMSADGTTISTVCINQLRLQHDGIQAASDLTMNFCNFNQQRYGLTEY